GAGGRPDRVNIPGVPYWAADLIGPRATGEQKTAWDGNVKAFSKAYQADDTMDDRHAYQAAYDFLKGRLGVDDSKAGKKSAARLRDEWLRGQAAAYDRGFAAGQ